MSDEASGIAVTIKYGKGYDESWVTFRGDGETVRRDIVGYFGVDSASVTDLSLDSLVQNVTQLAHGVGAAAAALGAVVVSEQPAEKPASSEDPWAVADARIKADASAPPVRNPVLDLIEQVDSVEALKVLYVDQKIAENAELAAAWNVKGKALKAAAAA